MSNPEKDPVVYGTASDPTFQRSITTRWSYAEVLTRLRKSIEAADVWVLAEVDAQMLVAKDGYRIGSARQILCFHPRYMARLLAADTCCMPARPRQRLSLLSRKSTTFCAYVAEKRCGTEVRGGIEPP